jgi:hypothetical protein
MTDYLTIHHLWFTVEAITPISLPAEAGPAIRGALITALRQHYCPDASLRPQGSRIEQSPEHRALCPVCWLIAEEDAAGVRGRNIPRSYTIEPPTALAGPIGAGGTLSFGISLIGRAINLYPYLVLAVPEMGRAGLGHFDARQGGRGQFRLRSIAAINPLSGAEQSLLASGGLLQLPALPVGPDEIATAASGLAERARQQDGRLALAFHTPTRIIDGAHLVARPRFAPLLQRLGERIEALVHYYGAPLAESAPPLTTELLARADAVELVEDQTCWVDVVSGSRRLGRATPVGGFRGRVIYRSEDWLPLLPWLLWGQSVHVGKNAVKGDGWYGIEGCPGWPGWAEASGPSRAASG